MNKFNNNEEDFIKKLEEAKNYVQGELELDCFDGRWYAMDYKDYLECAFHIEETPFNKCLITSEEASEQNINIIECCNACDISYVE